MDKMKIGYEVILALAAEMTLDQAIHSFALERLDRLIDEALAAGDEQSFYELVQKRNELHT
ncbi:IDEAL domain-containing protein [Paenibacillus yanchengensis]|uniref:IDEAL domain-containing protein n=1 Tax=Paenibacillus yanchengensis TaxID=2035833 RepID=A0ABW4YJT4_9BACL